MISNKFSTDRFTGENFLRGYYFVLARQALYAFLISQQKRKVYLPEYCALGAYLPYEKLDFEIKTYKNDLHFNILKEEVEKDVIFHYIHHFGLYNQTNIDYLVSLKNQGLTIIDDRALTLSEKVYNEQFAAELYSYYKLANVPYGAEIKTDLTIFTEKDNSQIIIKNSERYLKREGAVITKYLTPLLYKIYDKLIVQASKYNDAVENYWNDSSGNLPEDNLLKRINFNDISKKRILYAKYIYESIDPKYLFDISKEAYLSQALIGFPIKIENQKIFQTYLMENGILGFTLRNGWNPHILDNPHPYFRNHYCLPINQNLSEDEIEKIVDVVNAN